MLAVAIPVQLSTPSRQVHRARQLHKDLECLRTRGKFDEYAHNQEVWAASRRQRKQVTTFVVLKIRLSSATPPRSSMMCKRSWQKSWTLGMVDWKFPIGSYKVRCTPPGFKLKLNFVNKWLPAILRLVLLLLTSLLSKLHLHTSTVIILLGQSRLTCRVNMFLTLQIFLIATRPSTQLLAH